MKTLWKEVFQLIMNTTNVAYSIIGPLELEATIWTVLLTFTNESKNIFFEVSITVVAIETRSSIRLLRTTFNFATEPRSVLFTGLLFVQYFVD